MSLDSFNTYDQEETTKKPETKNSQENNDGIGEEEALLLVDKEFGKETKEVITEAQHEERLLKTEILLQNNPLANLYYKSLKEGKGEEVKPLIAKLKEMKIEDRPHNVFTKIGELKDESQAMDLFTSTLETQGAKVGLYAMNSYQLIKDKPYAQDYLQAIARNSPLTAIANIEKSLVTYDSDGNRSEYTMSEDEQNIIKNQALNEEFIARDVDANPDSALRYFNVYKDQPYAQDILKGSLETNQKKMFSSIKDFQGDPELQKDYLSMITDPSMSDVREKVTPSNMIKNIKVVNSVPVLQAFNEKVLSPEKISKDYNSGYFDNFDDWKDLDFAPIIIENAGKKGTRSMLDHIQEVEKIEGGSEVINQVLLSNADSLFDNDPQKGISSMKSGKRNVNTPSYFKDVNLISSHLKQISKDLKANPPNTMSVEAELIATSPKISSLLGFVDTEAKPFIVKNKELALDRRSIQFMSGMMKLADKNYPDKEDLGPDERSKIHSQYEKNLNDFLDKHEEKKQENDTVDVFFAYASKETPGEDEGNAFLKGSDLKAQYEESYGGNNVLDFSSNTENAQAPNSMMDKIRDQLVQKVIAGNGGLSLVDIGLHGATDGRAIYGPRDKVINDKGETVFRPRNEGRDWNPADFERLVNISKEVRTQLEKDSPDSLKSFEEKFGSFDDRIQIHIDSCFSGNKLDDKENTVKNIALSSGKQEALNLATDWILDAHKRDEDGNLKGDFDGDGKVTFAESKLYQLAHYSSSITKTTFGNDKGETIELANIDSQKNPEYDDRYTLNRQGNFV